MSAASPARLEAIAEAVVFAHEPAVAAPAATIDGSDLERTAALAMVAFAANAPPTRRVEQALAAAGLAFCAERSQQPRPAASTGGRSRSPAVGGRVVMFLLGVAALGLIWLGAESARRAPSASGPHIELSADPRTVQRDWQPGPSPRRGRIQGRVVWNGERQQGTLHFRGLPPLDSEHRFQLWIVDATREGAPVDGGLFQIEHADRETVVPVQARLPIGEAKAFVVTIEARQGVVVSKQEHVVAIAGL